jgi:hypothetical protein
MRCGGQPSRAIACDVQLSAWNLQAIGNPRSAIYNL